MPTDNLPISNQTPSDRRPAGPPLWMGFKLRMQPTATTPYTYKGSPCKDSPSELHGEKTKNTQTDSELGRVTVQSGDLDDLSPLHPNSLTPKYSRTTKYRWGCFLLHIIFCFIVLGIAVAIHQAANEGIWEAYPQGSQMQKRRKGSGQHFEENFKGLPPPEYARLGFWRVAPFVSVIPSGLAIATLWILDVYYPLTWVSKPKGQVLYVLSIMLFQCGIVVAWCYITPIACWFISNGSKSRPYRMVFVYSWTVAACLLAQIVILSIVVVLIILTISRHIQAGRREALDHPLCRYNPVAPRSLRLLPMSQSTVAPSQSATTNAPSVPSNAHPPRYGFTPLASSVESPAESDVQAGTQRHQIPAARTATAPSTVGESESSQ